MKKVIALAVLVIVVGSVIVAGAKDPDSQKKLARNVRKCKGIDLGCGL